MIWKPEELSTESTLPTNYAAFSRTVEQFYPSSAVDHGVAVEKQLDHIGASPLAGHVQRTDAILQHHNTIS